MVLIQNASLLSKKQVGAYTIVMSKYLSKGLPIYGVIAFSPPDPGLGRNAEFLELVRGQDQIPYTRYVYDRVTTPTEVMAISKNKRFTSYENSADGRQWLDEIIEQL